MTPEEFEAHSIWSVIRNILEGLKALNDQSNPDTHFAQRIIFIATYIQGFKTEYSELFTQQSLDTVASTLTDVNNNNQNFINTQNVAYLQNAFRAAEVALDQVRNWPTSVNSQAKKIITGYKSLLSDLEADQDRIKAKIVLLENNLQILDKREQDSDLNLKARIDPMQAALTTFESKFANIQENYAGALVNFASKFDQEKIARDKEFEIWLLTQADEFETLAKHNLEDMNKIVNTAQTRLEELGAIADLTLKVADMTSSDVLTSEYKSTAKSDKRWAIALFIIGALLLIGGLPLIIFAFKQLPNSTFSWSLGSYKLALVSILIGAAGVPISLGTRFMDQYNRFKQTELELRAINPFLADITDKVERDKIKKAFIEKSFANQNGRAEKFGLRNKQIVSLGNQIAETLKAQLDRKST